MINKILALAILSTLSLSSGAMADEIQYISVAGDAGHAGGGTIRYGHRIQEGNQLGAHTFLTGEIQAKRVAVDDQSNPGTVHLADRFSIAPTLHVFQYGQTMGGWVFGGIVQAGVEVGNGATPALMIGFGVEAVEIFNYVAFDIRVDMAAGRPDSLSLGVSKFF